MKYVKRYSLIFFAIIILACNIPIMSFAVVDPALASVAVASMVDAYGMYYGINTTYDVSQPVFVKDSFTQLWAEFNTYNINNDKPTYNLNDVYQEMFNDGVIIKHTHSSGNFAGFYIDATSALFLDRFWNWLLSGPAQLVEVNNQFFWNRENNLVVPSLVNNFSTYEINGKTVHSLAEHPIRWSPSSNENYRYYLRSGNAYYYIVQYSYSNGNKYCALWFLGNGAFSVDMQYANSLLNWQTTSTFISNSPDSSHNHSWLEIDRFFKDSWNGIPHIDAVDMNYDYQHLFGDNNPIITIGQNVYIDPYDDIVINEPSIPYVDSVDYVPQAVEITTNIPWDDNDYGDVFPLPDAQFDAVVSDFWDSIFYKEFALEVEIEEEEPPPLNEVVIPFLPVNLPSFNFTFSGIWHYVREWVSSLGAWFTMVFTIWASLPYAIIVPVYATAVIVIVLGVYKRFFM